MKKSGMILAAVCMMAMSHGASAATLPSKATVISAPVVAMAKSTASSAKGNAIHSIGGSEKSLKKDEKSNNNR